MYRSPAHLEWIPARVLGKAGARLMVVLAAPGCAYARSSGGCTNCGFPQAFGTGRAVSTGEYLAQVREALERIPTGHSEPVEVDLYNSGSYFNPDEVPEPAQAALLSLAASRPEVAALLVETRPEYVTFERLEKTVAACAGKPLEIAIGLESANAEILQRRIHKGYAWEDFAAAAELMAKAGARLLAYVLLKPINTSEREAIEDAVSTAEQVFALAQKLNLPARIALEPCFVAPDTPLHQAFLQGRYRPPWLWSVMEVVSRIAPLGPVLVGLSDEGMNSQQVAHNCAECSQRLVRALARFNRAQDLSVFSDIACGCRRRWESETTAQDGPTGAEEARAL